MLGTVYKYHLNYKEAIKQFQISLQLKPTLIDAYISLGIIYLRQGRYKDSIQMFLISKKYESINHIC